MKNKYIFVVPEDDINEFDISAITSLMQMKTQGKKGMKAARINMAFAPDTYKYVKIVSKAKGITITEFVNQIIRQHMDLPGHRETLYGMECLMDQMK